MKQFEELQPFFMRMSLSGPMQNLAVQIVQRSKQGKGSVPFVVMGLRSNVLYSEWKTGLGSFQGLALALFVATEHTRARSGGSR